MLQKILASLRRPTVLFLLVGIAIAIATAVFLWHRTRQAAARELQAEQLRLPDTLRVVTLSGATTAMNQWVTSMSWYASLLKVTSSR